jgi:hypothetical protein
MKTRTPRVTDTTADAERVLQQIYRDMPPWRKLEIVNDAIHTSRHLAMMGLRLRHPNDDEVKLRRRLLSLVLGEELATRVYGPLSKMNDT